MQSQRITEHSSDALRFIVVGERGPLELRITAAWAALLLDGEAEATPGNEIAVLWRASGHDDRVIWARLEQMYDRFTADAVDTAPLPGPEWAAVRAAAAWCDFTAGHGSSADLEAAEEAHMGALRAVLHAKDSA